MQENRPDPDALLARVQSAEPGARRGRLKLFFGMCAGVGKTYAMLSEAHEKRREGRDVVIGIAETHRRKETEALLEGLEQLPQKALEYRGVTIREFDLDGALARRPTLIVVDELAHTNAEGSRHTKRWQDVLELLEAGIDVYTALNVQHVESLNDIVAQITGVIIREAVPDSVIERADEIELVDIPPEDLLQRLHEGRVYVPQQVQQAISQFFRKENLVALRELALRETAARVSAQVQLERAGKGETKPWATSDRILVCVGPSPLSARVIRIARRMAAASQSDWIALHVDRLGQSTLATAQARRNLKLAERLGAETVVLTGDQVADEILAYAIRQNITKIVIGKPEIPRWREWLHGSVVNSLIRRSGAIDVHVVKGEPEQAAAPRDVEVARPMDWRGYAWAASVMAACTALGFIAFPYLSAVNLTMIYLAGVVFIATRHSAGPSVAAAVLGSLLYNFFFTAPYFSFAISDSQYLIAFGALLATGLVVSGLAQRVRNQSEAARMRYLRTLALYFMSHRLAATKSIDELARFSTRHIADVFSGETAILLPNPSGRLEVAAHHGEFSAESANEKAAALWVFENQKWAGWSTETLSAATAIYLPLISSDRVLGVLALRPRQPDRPLEPDQRHLLETFATQLAIALERATFASQAESARRSAETEQIRSSLLSCISHDLRTPLAAIAGAASTLVENSASLSEAARRELAESISDEAGRLNHLVGKLLEMTRLESAGFQLEKEWYPLEELVGAALSRPGAVLRHHKVVTDLHPGLPLVYVDGCLIEEALGNLLENAARYTPAGSTVTIRATADSSAVTVEVIDDGPGLQPGTEKEIFRRFVRSRPATDRHGTGLGLAICDAVIRLHGGEIGAESVSPRGARFWFTLPLNEQSPSEAGTAGNQFATAAVAGLAPGVNRE